MSGYKYRPIMDFWLLARTKSHYYGGYPEGFLWRAKGLLPGSCVHLCSGALNNLPGDVTVDINLDLLPDIVADATKPIIGLSEGQFDSALLDPPYSPEDAVKYNYPYPKPVDLLREAYRIVKVGGRIGILHQLVPKPPKGTKMKLIACIAVLCGYNNRVRAFTVFSKEE